MIKTIYILKNIINNLNFNKKVFLYFKNSLIINTDLLDIYLKFLIRKMKVYKKYIKKRTRWGIYSRRYTAA